MREGGGVSVRTLVGLESIVSVSCIGFSIDIGPPCGGSQYADGVRE